jgi:hypothetical protein
MTWRDVVEIAQTISICLIAVNLYVLIERMK